MTSKYPEHEKLSARAFDSRLLSDFYDFLGEQGWEIAKWNGETKQLYAIRERPDEIIGLFLGIDPKKLEVEKVAMLAEIRSKDNER